MAGEFPIVFALYPRVTQLDFTGPLEVLARLPGAAIVLAAVRGGELAVDSGISFANARPLAEVQECALLCVPGGFGTAAAPWRIRCTWRPCAASVHGRATSLPCAPG